MTPTQILTAARNKYNAIGDSFFSDEEMMGLLYEASLEMATETNCIERLYTTSTVVDQREYDFPSLAIGIKRIEYNGQRLEKVSFEDDDFLTGFDTSSTSTGTPRWYSEWNKVIYLRSTPDAVGTLTIYTYNEPDTISTTSTLEIPVQFHRRLANFVTKEMCFKDQNYSAADRLQERWERDKRDVKQWMARKKRASGFSVVQSEELSGGILRG